MLKMLTALLIAAVSVLPVPDDIPARQPKELTFAVLSDVHVMSGDAAAKSRMTRALKDAAGTGAEAIVFNGDMGNGRPQDYDEFARTLAKAPHPASVYYTIGNHEFYSAWMNKRGWAGESFPNGETDAAAIGRFLKFAGRERLYEERRINGCRFLFLGSESFVGINETERDKANLSRRQLDWLKRQLVLPDDRSKPVFVFLHQPLSDTVQRDELLRVLQTHPRVFFFSGHTHYELKSTPPERTGNVVQVNSSSVYDPWDAQTNASIPGDASEGLLVTVGGDGSVTIRGRDFVNGRSVYERRFPQPEGAEKGKTPIL